MPQSKAALKLQNILSMLYKDEDTACGNWVEGVPVLLHGSYSMAHTPLFVH